MAYGNGSLSWEPQRARWVASIELPRSRGERRRRKIFTGKSRDVVEAKLSAYRDEHPPPARLGRAAYLAQAREAGPGHTDSQWWALVRSVGKRCHYCGVVTDVYGHAAHAPDHIARDHRTPLSRGGSDAIDNIAVSCRGCNGDKGSMTEAEYAAWKATQ